MFASQVWLEKNSRRSVVLGALSNVPEMLTLPPTTSAAVITG